MDYGVNIPRSPTPCGAISFDGAGDDGLIVKEVNIDVTDFYSPP